MSANGSRSTESEACENADDGDDSEEFDEGERCHGAERDEGVKGRRRVENCGFLILDFGLKSWICSEGFFGRIFLVERTKSGCSHSHEHNFITQISKGKKQLLHVGGVAGGDFDHWVARGVRFAGDQRGDSGREKGGGVGDGGIDQDSRERILCGVFGISFKREWYDGFDFFEFNEHNQHKWRKLSRNRVSGGAAQVHQCERFGHAKGLL